MYKKVQELLNAQIIDTETATKISEQITAKKQQKCSIILNSIAAIMLLIGLMLFCFHHINLISKIISYSTARILMITIPTILCFWGGYNLAYEKKTNTKLGNTLIIIALLLLECVFANISYEFKIYDGSALSLFVWLLCLLPIAYKLENRAINYLSAFAIYLLSIGFYGDLAIDTTKLWTIYLPIISGVAIYSISNLPFVKNKKTNLSLDYKIFGSSLILLTMLILVCSAEPTYRLKSLFYIVPIVFWGILNLINFIIQFKKADHIFKIETFTMELLLFFLLLVLLCPVSTVALMLIFPNIFIISIVVFANYFGKKQNNQCLVKASKYLLATVLVLNYCTWGWIFLSKTVFFTLGGILILLCKYIPTLKSKFVK